MDVYMLGVLLESCIILRPFFRVPLKPTKRRLLDKFDIEFYTCHTELSQVLFTYRKQASVQ